MATFGENLKRRRKELGLSLQDVAEAVGVSKSTVMKWERGSINNMSRKWIPELTKVLQTTYEDLMGDDEDKYFDYDPTKPQLTQQQEVLFDATADLSEIEMDAVLRMIDVLKSTRIGRNGY